MIRPTNGPRMTDGRDRQRRTIPRDTAEWVSVNVICVSADLIEPVAKEDYQTLASQRCSGS